MIPAVMLAYLTLSAFIGILSNRLKWGWTLAVTGVLIVGPFLMHLWSVRGEPLGTQPVIDLASAAVEYLLIVLPFFVPPFLVGRYVHRVVSWAMAGRVSSGKERS